MRKKKRIGHRRKGIEFDYDFDCRFRNERWDSADKRYWQRWQRRELKAELLGRDGV